ncbi:hypothetical protein SA6_12140, partial [Staphylococcus epidermidis]
LLACTETPAPSGAAVSVQARRTWNDGNDLCSNGQGTPRVDRRGHDGLQGGVDRDRRRHDGGAGLAAQEGPVQGCQEGRSRRGRRPDRRADRRHQGRAGRGQFGDRLRRAQRAVPGPGQDDCSGRAEARLRRRGHQGRQGWRLHRGAGDLGRDRDHRREHVAAPRRFARGEPGRGVELRPQ